MPKEDKLRVSTSLLNERIVGLDIEKGLERFGGDEETFIEILRSYAENTRPLLERLEKLEHHITEEYTIIVHGIKGSSRGIYANAVGTKAETLEYNAKLGNLDYIKANNHELIVMANKLIDDINVLLDKIKEQAHMTILPHPEASVLTKVLEAARNYDVDTIDELMVFIGQFEYESGKDLLEWLHLNIVQSNFTEICERLESYLKTIS
jgi:HPt (histidine-containing phosphotransfer) domain-containing protein